MKKQILRRNAAKEKKQPMRVQGQVVLDLAIWCFEEDEDLIRHTADQLAKALHVSYNMDNFGPQSFGLTEEEEE